MAHNELLPWVKTIDFLFDNLIYLVLAAFFFLKGLNFRRLTLLGRMLAIDALTMGALFLLAFISQWWDWEGIWWLRIGIRIYLAVILFRTLLAMSWTYGGWKAMHLRAWRNLREMVRLRRIPIEYGPADRVVD